MNEKRAVLSSQTPQERQCLSRGKNPGRHRFDWTLVNEVFPLHRCYRSAVDEIVVSGAHASLMEVLQSSLESGRPDQICTAHDGISFQTPRLPKLNARVGTRTASSQLPVCTCSTDAGVAAVFVPAVLQPAAERPVWVCVHLSPIAALWRNAREGAPFLSTCRIFERCAYRNQRRKNEF